MGRQRKGGGPGPAALAGPGPLKGVPLRSIGRGSSRPCPTTTAMRTWTSSPEDLVGNADAALYKAKRAGKDRVESYGRGPAGRRLPRAGPDAAQGRETVQ